MKKFLNWIPRWLIAFYSLWVLLHIILLLVFERTFEYKYHFWPFAHTQTYWYKDPDLALPFYYYFNSYDYTEFIIYVLSPIFITIAIYHFRKGRRVQTEKPNV